MNGHSDRRGRRPLVRFLALLLKLAVVAGVLLHLTVRDLVPVLAVAYYALPRSALAVLALLAAVASLALRARLRGLVWFAASLGLFVWWQSAEWRPAASSTEPTGLRVMYWNVGRGVAGWDAVIRRVEYEQPDLVALGETAYPTGEFRALWRERLPNYDISFVGGGMMCLVRGTSSGAKVRRIDDYTHVRELDVAIDGAALRCLIVDVYAHPLYDRRPALSAIAQLAEGSAERPLLVLGDFNTPLDSAHFRDLRQNHVNAFETAGAGYVATWPAYAPVLSLDQIWTNRHVEVLACRHGRTSVSDPRPVLATIRLAAATPAVPETGN